MTIHEAKSALNSFPTFGLGTIRLFDPGFAQQSLSRWKSSGRIVMLAPGHYAFPDSLGDETDLYAAANSIYRPSYVSLESALSSFGLIPETVRIITSVCTRKTRRVDSPAGSFRYRSVSPDLFFGYLPINGTRHSYLMARPEKAILDFLYLNPSYNGPDELRELRIAPEAFALLSRRRLDSYCRRFGQASLQARLDALCEVMSDARA
ncbi:MAG: hypothetical protein QUS11_07145 [Candidatus Fermentibacter sp.]|nr:hypothetical protein [Candidatus Fermentibacter sp.]